MLFGVGCLVCGVGCLLFAFFCGRVFVSGFVVLNFVFKFFVSCVLCFGCWMFVFLCLVFGVRFPLFSFCLVSGFAVFLFAFKFLVSCFFVALCVGCLFFVLDGVCLFL